MKRIPTSLITIALALTLSGCQTQPTTVPSVSIPEMESVAGACELTVLNGSGRTLVESDTTVYEQNKVFVKLPRMTYWKLRIPAGRHEFRYFRGGWGSRGLAVLEAKPGERYFLYVEYSPGRSWAFPLGGWPERIQVIPEEDAVTRMKIMKPAQ